MIDEYQTLTTPNINSRILARAHQNICAVGDNDQAIYGWRQADITNILNFEKITQTLKLSFLKKTIAHAKHPFCRQCVIKKINLVEEKSFTQGETAIK